MLLAVALVLPHAEALLRLPTSQDGSQAHHHHHHRHHHERGQHHRHGHHHHAHHHGMQAAEEADQSRTVHNDDGSSADTTSTMDSAGKVESSVKPQNAPATNSMQTSPDTKLAQHSPTPTSMSNSDKDIIEKMQSLQNEVDSKEKQVLAPKLSKGELEVQGPLPSDFPDLFARGVAAATGCAVTDVKLLTTRPRPEVAPGVDEIIFEAKSNVVAAVEDQAADVASKLASGPLQIFLTERMDSQGRDSPEKAEKDGIKKLEISMKAKKKVPDIAINGNQKSKKSSKPDVEPTGARPETAPPDIDTEMPYGDLEPFGREDTARELTQSSIQESDAMVDQLERAEVAEERRAVFRALTHLRGAAITAYDGIARAHTGNMDEYNRQYHWRSLNKVQHLAQAESDTKKWAFPGSDC